MTEEKKRKLAAALSDIRQHRWLIAEFLAQLEDVPANITEHCRTNDWNDAAALTIREAGFKLGTALAILDRWEVDAEIPREVIDAVDAEYAERKED